MSSSLPGPVGGGFSVGVSVVPGAVVVAVVAVLSLADEPVLDPGDVVVDVVPIVSLDDEPVLLFPHFAESGLSP